MDVVKTKTGAYIIADISDPQFYPGKKVPADYESEAADGSWFFWKASWLDDDFGGSVIARLRGYPMNYSIGYPTAETALTAAEEWEANQPRRKLSTLF
jgi:hypothetical protein